MDMGVTIPTMDMGDTIPTMDMDTVDTVATPTTVDPTGVDITMVTTTDIMGEVDIILKPITDTGEWIAGNTPVTPGLPRLL
jgi:hypothetical protein